MKFPKILALSGASGSGKDVVAKYLCDKHGFTRVGFSDALKAEVAKNFRRSIQAHIEEAHPELAGWTGTIAHHRLLWEDRCPFTRALLQEFGTEVRREENPNYWTIAWVQRWRKMHMPKAVVPDVRFENELSILEYYQAQLLHIIRPGHELPESVATHSSETSLDTSKWPTIINDGTIEDLQRKIDGVLNAGP